MAPDGTADVNELPVLPHDPSPAHAPPRATVNAAAPRFRGRLERARVGGGGGAAPALEPVVTTPFALGAAAEDLVGAVQGAGCQAALLASKAAYGRSGHEPHEDPADDDTARAITPALDHFTRFEPLAEAQQP